MARRELYSTQKSGSVHEFYKGSIYTIGGGTHAVPPRRGAKPPANQPVTRGCNSCSAKRGPSENSPKAEFRGKLNAESLGGAAR